MCILSLEKTNAFVFNNWNFIQFLFISIYGLEQILLITFIAGNHNKTFVASLFSVVFLTTFAFHELFMRWRIEILEKKIFDIDLEKQSLMNELKRNTVLWKSFVRELERFIIKKNR